MASFVVSTEQELALVMEAASESNDKKNTIIIKASELTLSEGLVYDGDGDLNLRGDGVNLIANSESGID